MNITVKKRTRIAEIIVGIVLICFSVMSFRSFWLIYFPDMSYFRLRITPYLLIPVLSTLFRILLAVMLMFRLYHSLPVKILYCITVPGLLLNSRGGSILLGYFFEPYSVFTASGSYYENHDLILFTDILMFLLVLAAAVVAFLTMNRNIVWKSRKHLLIYTYAITGLYMAQSLIRLHDYFAVLLFMLPCLMQDYTVNKNTKGITGCAAFALKPVLPAVIGYFYAHYYDGMASGFSYITTGKSNISSNGSEQYILFMACLNILLVLLTPLMLFERKCTEAEDVAQVKKSKSDDEEDDDDEYDEDEYEDDEEDEDESDDND
ncbi:MAG: hypothetical protein IKH96_11230 [Ruminococcus sp.]|uniref:hypothetical protein n=1 Tax=Ruminococcus sp. TaxID=41978 RepID=UPI0025D2E931|nr:hypothetical protein [Ruminococcus sp.]MBR6996572.1 hypothetical protein [Ruminococcus sp.]